jgi:hypothetical protein
MIFGFLRKKTISYRLFLVQFFVFIFSWAALGLFASIFCTTLKTYAAKGFSLQSLPQYTIVLIQRHVG